MIATLLAALTLAAPASRVELPEAFTAGVPGEVSTSDWWDDLGDPALGDLVDEALRANPDLDGARWRVNQVRSLGNQAFSAMVPSVSADLQASLAPTDALGFGFGLPQSGDRPKTYTSGSALIRGQLAVDVWGRSWLTYQAGKLEARAAAGDRDGLRSTVAAMVAEAWFDVVAAQERVALVRQQLATQDALLEVVELQYSKGLATALDVLQARQQRAALAAQVPQVSLVLDLSRHRLNLLIGHNATAPLPEPGTLVDLPPAPSIGDPDDLLDNRPDLRAARARLDAARNRHLSATRSVLPTVAVTGSGGRQWVDIGEIQWLTTWNLGGSLSIPLFQGGRNYESIRAARAERYAASTSLDSAVLSAVQEVEASLSTEAARLEALAAIQVQAEASEAAFTESRSRYIEGLAPYLSVLTAADGWFRAQQSLLQARRDLLGARIQLHQSLGGAWTREAR